MPIYNKQGKIPAKRHTAFTKEDGSIYYVDVTIMPIYTKEGYLQEYVAISSDTTALHQYTFNASLSMDSTDQILTNNTAQTMYLDITDTTMARAV